MRNQPCWSTVGKRGRIVGIGLVMLLPFVAVVTLSGPATASTALRIECTGIRASLSTGTWKVTGCPAAATGGRSLRQPFLLGSSTTTTWANGKSTSWTYNLNVTFGGPCGAIDEITVLGTVTADTTGFAPVGGLVKGIVCFNESTGSFSLAPGTAWKWK
jgi:hypothetical protein